MSESLHAIFERECCAAFRRLVDVYGFGQPVIKQIGHESFVRYSKGNREISISYEYGASPLVELFYPSSETGERPTPWAEKNAVQRSRRIPRLQVAEPFSAKDETSFGRYLDACAKALERVESAFLK
jgi:hypothetical protein